MEKIKPSDPAADQLCIPSNVGPGGSCGCGFHALPFLGLGRLLHYILNS